MRCRKEFPENVQHKHHHKTEQHDFCRRLDWSPSWWGPEGIMWCLWLVMLFIDVYRCLSFFLHAAQEVERTVFYGFGCAPWQHPSRALVSDVPYVKPKRTQKLCMDDMAYFGINFVQISSKLQPGLSASPFVSMQLGHHDWHYDHRIGKLLVSFVCVCMFLCFIA